jgi:hypothetical protein
MAASDAQRVTVALSGDRHHPGLGLGGDIEAQTAGVGPGRRIAGQGNVHEPLVAIADRGRIEAESLHRSRAQILDQHVAAVDQAQGRLSPFVSLQVKDDGPLAPVAVGPDCVAVGAHVPSRISNRRLDLDDVGAEVCQHTTDAGACDIASELDDPVTGQWSSHLGVHRSTGITSSAKRFIDSAATSLSRPPKVNQLR